MKLASSLKIKWQVSEASETLSGVYVFELVRYMYIYIFITQACITDKSDGSAGVDYFSIFNPNIPPLVLGMLVG